MREVFDCVVGGHVCLDIIPMMIGDTFTLEPGRLVQAGPVGVSAGGAVANTGLALHKLGVKTSMMGKVGTDWVGNLISERLLGIDRDIHDGMARTPGESSSYSIVLSVGETDRMVLHNPGCNDTFTAQDIDFKIVERARLFHFGYPPLMRSVIERDGAELRNIFEAAKDTGVTTSLDMSLPDPYSFSGSVKWTSILATTLPFVDIFAPSLAEVLFIFRRGTFESLLNVDPSAIITHELLSCLGEELLSMGPKIVGLKLGSFGLYVRTADSAAFLSMGRGSPRVLHSWSERELWSPCFQVAVTSTVGAGDTTIAGFLAGLLKGLSVTETMAMACAVGACCVEAADATSGVRTWDETRLRVAAGWPRKVFPISSEDWVEDHTTGVWCGPDDSHHG